jgi:hypothetical protein
MRSQQNIKSGSEFYILTLRIKGAEYSDFYLKKQEGECVEIQKQLYIWSCISTSA